MYTFAMPCNGQYSAFLTQSHITPFPYIHSVQVSKKKLSPPSLDSRRDQTDEIPIPLIESCLCYFSVIGSIDICTVPHFLSCEINSVMSEQSVFFVKFGILPEVLRNSKRSRYWTRDHRRDS